jgi:catechol 2,3-dioxygenase-like lactoylglutathione lyase family enzyme
VSTTIARRIDHVAIAVVDADASARWYVEELGMRIAADEIIASANVRLVALAPTRGATDQTFVQLAQPVGPGRIDDFLRAHGEGLQHICFLVDDTAASAALLGADPAAVFAGGGGRPMCFLSERPNGVTVELAQPAAIS